MAKRTPYQTIERDQTTLWRMVDRIERLVSLTYSDHLAPEMTDDVRESLEFAAVKLVEATRALESTKTHINRALLTR